MVRTKHRGSQCVKRATSISNKESFNSFLQSSKNNRLNDGMCFVVGRAGEHESRAGGCEDSQSVSRGGAARSVGTAAHYAAAATARRRR